MGFRSFLKGKLEKHGGVTGLAAHASQKVVGGAKPVVPEPKVTPVPLPIPVDLDAEGYRAVAYAARITEGNPGQFEAHGATVAVFRVEDTLYAIDNACLHEDGPLGEATQEGVIAVCPYHDWRYDVRDGRCLTRKDRRVGSWSVRERDGFVWIGPRLTRGSDDRGGDHDDGLRTV